MKYEDFAEELKAKKRSLKDLIRYISNRTDENPNYTLLLGAGCSVTSGVKSASKLADMWRQELYTSFAGDNFEQNASIDTMRNYLQHHQGNWYDISREYSSLFEKRYDLQRQRRMFVETEVASKTPSIGYAYITSLVSQNYFNTIFTTNFDDLLNEAFYTYSDQRPIVCAHDSSINSVTVTSKRPKIIKLHGDYLFDDLKSTNRETETLEQNIKAKFLEFGKEYGMIVLGYSGGDRSIMDVLSSMLKNEEYFKGGIYWCVRKGSEISEELRKLLWRERVFFVEVEGFDEVFAETYSSLNKNEILPSALMNSSKRPTDISTRLLASELSFPESSALLLSAKEQLQRLSKRTALVNLLVNPEGSKNSNSNISNTINDDELYLLTEIQSLISTKNYNKAIDLARAKIHDELKVYLKIRILRLIIQAYQLLKQTTDALNVVEEIIKLEPNKAIHLHLKAAIYQKYEDKLRILNQAIEVDAYSVQSYTDKAHLLYSQSLHIYGPSKKAVLQEALDTANKSLLLDPSRSNDCWRVKFNIIDNLEIDVTKAKVEKIEIIELLNIQNPYTPRVLNLRASMLDKDLSNSDILLNDLDLAVQRSGSEYGTVFGAIRLKVYAKLQDLNKLKNEIDKLLCLPQAIEDEDLVNIIARIYRENFADDLSAIALLDKALKIEFDEDLLRSLIEAYNCLEKYEDAENIFNEFKNKLSDDACSNLLVKIFDAQKKYAESIIEIERYERISGISRIQHKLYLKLKQEDWKSAEQIAREILEPIHFDITESAEIVNYELARKKLGKNVDPKRLENVLRYSDSAETKAAVFALLDKIPEVISNIKEAMKLDKAFRFQAIDWPVFNDLKKNPGFQAALQI